jgi:hypothetical protein
LDIFFRNAKSIATGTMAISTHGNTIAVDNKESTKNVTRSPLLAHVNTTSQGLHTIVPFNQQQKFIDRYIIKIFVICKIFFM